MRSLEPKVKKDSDYYVHHPSVLATKIYLYPTSIGNFYYEAGYHLRRQSFDSFLLMYLAKGACMLVQEGGSVRVAQDSFVLLDCYAPHEYFYEEEAQTLWMHFDGALARSYYELITGSHGPVLSLGNSYPAAHAMRRILRQFREALSLSESDISASITEILTFLLDAPARTNALPAHDRVIEKALAYIGEHFAEPLSLDVLAANSSMSLYHFTRVFSEETGFTPHQYLIATRLNSAKFLLRTTGSISVKEIAYRSGFNSESGFCATFRKWEKMTPSEYRSRALSDAR